MRKFLFYICVVLSGCSPKITSSITSAHTSLAKDVEVMVLEIDTPMPEKAEVLGQIKIGDTGFTTKNGDYGYIVDGRYQSVVRVDPPTPVNSKGPNEWHFHLNGNKEHIFDWSKWPWKL